MENENYYISKLKQQMPQYPVPESVWESVEGQFRVEEESDRNLKRAIAGLPVYLPPKKIWGAIEKSLREKQGFAISTNFILKIAAVFIIVLAIGFLIRDRKIGEQYKKLAVVEKPTQLNLNDGLKETPHQEDIESKQQVATQIPPASRKKPVSQKNEMLNERDAIEKMELVTMPAIKLKKLGVDKKKEQALLSDNLMKTGYKAEGNLKIIRVKLMIHNDLPAQVPDKRRITFALFRPVSYSLHTKDTLSRNTKPLFAASINL